MICPQCGAKYPPGVTRCPECDVELVDDAARVPQDGVEWVDDVVVLETTDEGQLMVARSMLEAEGIRCFAQGEEGQQLIGAGPVRLRYASPTKRQRGRSLPIWNPLNRATSSWARAWPAPA